MTSTSLITLVPIFLLSSDEIDVSSLENALDGIGDMDQLWEVLLERFSVAVFFDGYPVFAVITKDSKVVSFLEQAPEGKWEETETNEE